MKKILFNARILSDEGELVRADISVENGMIASLNTEADGTSETYDLRGAFVMPGAVDVHAHLREPGFEYKETVLSGTLSAAKGGITALMAMPNLNPVPDSREHLKAETDIIGRDAVVAVYPFGAVTVGEKGKELADIAGLAPHVRAFSDDGRGVNDLNLLKKAMLIAKKYDRIIASHAEKEGYGTSPEAEIYAVEAELELVKETGCKYHFCHLSTAKSLLPPLDGEKLGYGERSEAQGTRRHGGSHAASSFLKRKIRAARRQFQDEPAATLLRGHARDGDRRPRRHRRYDSYRSRSALERGKKRLRQRA